MKGRARFEAKRVHRQRRRFGDGARTTDSQTSSVPRSTPSPNHQERPISSGLASFTETDLKPRAIEPPSQDRQGHRRVCSTAPPFPTPLESRRDAVNFCGLLTPPKPDPEHRGGRCKSRARGRQPLGWLRNMGLLRRVAATPRLRSGACVVRQRIRALANGYLPAKEAITPTPQCFVSRFAAWDPDHCLTRNRRYADDAGVARRQSARTSGRIFRSAVGPQRAPDSTCRCCSQQPTRGLYATVCSSYADAG